MDTNIAPTSSPRRWRRPVVLAGLAVLVAGAAGLAVASGGPGHLARRLSQGHGFGHGEHARDFVEFKIHRALASVDATDAQEAEILAMVDSLFAQHQAHATFHGEMHDAVAAALTAETVDRAALEAVRAQALARADEGSRLLVKAIADMAEVLTPEQRRALAEQHRERFE